MNIKRHDGTIDPQDIINAVQVWSKLLIKCTCQNVHFINKYIKIYN